jgi:serine/threonine protein kinase
MFDHPKIVKLHKYTETAQEIVLIMEHCNDAMYLENKLENRKREIKNENKIRNYAKDILEALNLIHGQGIVHADIKLANILLHRPTDDEKAAGVRPVMKLCDFGIAQIIQPELFNGEKKALMKERSGTAHYIAPEVSSSMVPVGPEIDMWAFGIVLYEMCVAYKPTQVKNYRYGQGPIPFRPRDWKKLTNAGADV